VRGAAEGDRKIKGSEGERWREGFGTLRKILVSWRDIEVFLFALAALEHGFS